MSNHSYAHWKLRTKEIEWREEQKELLYANVWAHSTFQMTSKSLVVDGRGGISVFLPACSVSSNLLKTLSFQVLDGSVVHQLSPTLNTIGLDVPVALRLSEIMWFARANECEVKCARAEAFQFCQVLSNSSSSPPAAGANNIPDDEPWVSKRGQCWAETPPTYSGFIAWGRNELLLF